MTKEKKLSFWPFWGAAVLFMANVDFIIIPYILIPIGISFWAMYLIAILVANFEIFGWFYFWKWFTWKWLPHTEPVKDTVALTKNIINMLQDYGLLGTVVYKIRETFRWATSPQFKRSLERWGHFWMFFLGVEPFLTGGRMLGVISCGVARWKTGLISLCIGNAIHVYISIRTWDLIFYLWDRYKEWFILFGIVVILFLVGRYFWKKRRSTNGGS